MSQSDVVSGGAAGSKADATPAGLSQTDRQKTPRLDFLTASLLVVLETEARTTGIDPIGVRYRLGLSCPKYASTSKRPRINDRTRLWGKRRARANGGGHNTTAAMLARADVNSAPTRVHAGSESASYSPGNTAAFTAFGHIGGESGFVEGNERRAALDQRGHTSMDATVSKRERTQPWVIPVGLILTTAIYASIWPCRWASPAVGPMSRSSCSRSGLPAPASYDPQHAQTVSSSR